MMRPKIWRFAVKLMAAAILLGISPGLLLVVAAWVVVAKALKAHQLEQARNQADRSAAERDWLLQHPVHIPAYGGRVQVDYLNRAYSGVSNYAQGGYIAPRQA